MMMKKLRGILFVCLCLWRVTSVVCGEEPNEGSQKEIAIRSYPIDDSLGNYVFSAMAAHPNGRIYLGTSIKGRKFAHLVELDPSTGQVRGVADMLKVTGQTDKEMVPQSKIHTQIVVDKRGRLWFGTWAEEFRNTSFRNGYPGGHLVSYDPKTALAVDHGILVGPRVEEPKKVSDYGLYLIALDINRDRNELYILTGDEIRLLVYDITTGQHFTAGIIDGPAENLVHYGIRDLKVAADGNVYIFDHWGRIIRYDPERKKLEPLDLWIPGGNGQVMGLPFQVGINRSRTRIYGAGASGHRLFELDVSPGKPPRVVDLGPAYEAFTGLETPSLSLVHAVVVAADDRVVYPSTGGKRGELFMYDPVSGMRSHLGSMRVANVDSSQPVYASGGWAGCLAPDGTIYFGGVDRGAKKEQLCFFEIRVPVR